MPATLSGDQPMISATSRSHSSPGVIRFVQKVTRHFIVPDQVAAFDGGITGDEAQCAKALDSLPEVKHWLCNASQQPDAFWLPLARYKSTPTSSLS
jgi:hypothetical protein